MDAIISGMSKHIAFLRAINVGGHNVKMDVLREIFESLGVTHVETFIASGNVIFEVKTASIKALEKNIEVKLREELGYEVATFIRTVPELAEIAKYRSFSQAKLDASAALNIGFLAEPLDEKSIQKLMAMKTDIDDFHFHGREIYWLCQIKQSDSKISNAVIEKTLGVKSTLRGVNTVIKMAEKFC